MFEIEKETFSFSDGICFNVRYVHTYVYKYSKIHMLQE